MCYGAQVCRVAIFTSLLLAAVIVAGEPAFAQESGRERIVFSGGSGGVRNIYSINLDGTGLTRLTNDPMSGFPACASTGKIAFTSSRSGNRDIYVMNWDGTNQFKVTTNTSDDSFPAWSPDGQKIVFARYESLGYQLWVINADGSGEKRLTGVNTRDNYQPAWSPDGSKIAFSSNRGDSQQIWVMNADGSNPVNLSKSGNLAEYPSWSPDGSKVVFIRSNWPSSQLNVINADGTNEQVLVNSASISNETAWSPDGKHIAFSSTLNGGNLHRIHVVNADGGSVVRVSNGTDGDRAPCFQTPSTISFDKPDYTVGEAAGMATLTLRRTGASNGQVTARVTLTDVTTSAADYRYQPGALDPTYPQLPTGNPYYTSQMSFQSDGKLLVGSPVSRYNPDGTRDTTFQPAQFNAEASAIVQQPDGKIVVSGSFTTINNVVKNRIARLNADGSLDPTFDAGAGLNDFATTIIVQPDGKILLGGYFNSVNSTTRYHVARLNSDGSLDTTFQPPQLSTVYSMALQPDGKLLAVGSSVTRFNTDGSLDSTFKRPDVYVVLSIAVQADGKLLIGGNFNQINGTAVNHVARLNADGTLDQSFNTGAGPNFNVNAVAWQPDGKAIIAGNFTSFNGTPTTAALVRLNVDGSLDSSFQAHQVMPGNSPIQLLLMQPDGKILVGGYMTMSGPNFTRRNIARLENDLFVTWADGDSADKIITLPIADDLLDEPDETLTLTLNPLSANAVTSADATTTLTIVDNDVPPAFTGALPPSLTTKGTFYTHTFTATGFPAPTYSVTAGTLPLGLNLSTSGLLSGTTYAAGVYNLTITASNGVAPNASQTFSIKVNSVPLADHDTYNLAEDSTLNVAAPGVLSDDTDENNDPLTAELMSTTANGTLTFNSDGSFKYTPNANFNGSESFLYRVTDGHAYSFTTSVLLNVSAVNDAPVNSVPGAQVVVENSPLIFSAANGNPLSVSDIETGLHQFRVALSVTGGALTLKSTAGLTFFIGDGTADAALTFNGNLSSINSALAGMSFTPAKGFSGTATLQIGSSDLGQAGAGGILTDVDTVSISVLEGGAFRFGASTYSAGEKAGAITITVARAGGDAGAAAVNYSTSDGSASAGADYTPASGTLNFAPGETSKTFAIAITDDNLAEADETLTLTLGGAVGSGELGSPASAVLNIVDDDASTLQFSAANFQFSEAGGQALMTVTRAGDASGVASLDYRTEDADTFTVGCADTAQNNGGAYARCDFATTLGKLNFAAGEMQKTFTIPIIDDGHDESAETFRVVLSNPERAGLGATSTATVTITDNDEANAPNPIITLGRSDYPFFVRQQYLDFLSREPEQSQPWTAVLERCANVNMPPSAITDCDRIAVSGAFFGSPEFRVKGFYVFRFYKVAFNRLPQYGEIVSDMSFVAGQTTEEVYARKAQLATAFTARQEFIDAYSMKKNADYVEALLARYQLTAVSTIDPAAPDGATKVTLTAAELTNRLEAGTLTRAQVLRAVADSDEVGAAEYNSAFVAVQYYGYLRRTPDDNGYQAWLRVINQDPNNIRIMVNGFMNSTEYRLRFGR
jgi:uncharacterized delta-60 repeat protein